MRNFIEKIGLNDRDVIYFLIVNTIQALVHATFFHVGVMDATDQKCVFNPYLFFTVFILSFIPSWFLIDWYEKRKSVLSGLILGVHSFYKFYTFAWVTGMIAMLILDEE